MITLIGYTKTVIGMGLCGINKVHEVTENTPVEEIVEIIKKTDSEFILIDEEIYLKIHKLVKKVEKRFIKIPNPKGEENDPIDDIVRDTIGVSIKSD